MKQISLLFFFLALAFSCGKEGDEGGGAGTVDNALTGAFSTVNTTAGQITNLSPSSSFVKNNNKGILGGFGGSVWTDTLSGLNDERTNTSTSPKEWFGIQLSKNAKRSNGSSISMFGRLSDALGIFCAVGVGAGSTSDGGYPSNATYTINLSGTTKTTIESQCGLTIDSNMQGQNVTLLIEDASLTTYYDKKITITLPGPETQIYYIRSNSSAINIATSEVNSNGLHRTVVAFDKSSKVMKLEYISGPNAGLSDSDHVSAYRLYYDETNDKGYMVALEYNHSGIEETMYILAGKPKASGAKFALSFVSPRFGDAVTREACITASNGTIDTDNSLCANNTVSILGKTVTSSIADSFIVGWLNTNYNSVSDSTNLAFTDSDVDTVAFETN